VDAAAAVARLDQQAAELRGLRRTAAAYGGEKVCES
jgi:hypothetical protein